MNKIVVTPAGRKNNLEILYFNLKKRKSEFDEWHIWLNTQNAEDIEYMKQLEKTESWIQVEEIPHEYPHIVALRIYHFMLKNTSDKESVYLRLDDDICFIEKGAISKVFNARINSKDSLLVYGNIVNNSVMQYEYQKNGKILDFPLLSDYNNIQKSFGQDPLIWENGEFAYNLHKLFIEKYKNNDIKYFYIPSFLNSEWQRISINVVALRGDLNYILSDIDPDEEEYFAKQKPIRMGIPSEIVGNAIFCHYSYFPQKDYLDKTEILEEYKKIIMEEE